MLTAPTAPDFTDTLPDSLVAAKLSAIARAWHPFGSLSYTHPRVGTREVSIARVRHGAGTLGTARGKTPRAACANLLKKLLAAGVAVPS